MEDAGAGLEPAYVDPVSGDRFPLDEPRWRSPEGRPLMISPGRGIGPGDVDRAERSLWRYRRALPVAVAEPVTLGEGCTPLLPRYLTGGLAHVKPEWFGPTGSFKDRGASVMVSVLREQGVTSLIEDSSGNGGAAIAAYGAAAGLDVTVFAPDSTSPAKLAQARAYGASIELVPGPREASQEAAIDAADGGPRYASHNWQALFLEGTKTLAYELWEDLGFTSPDHVIVPVGAGSSLLGCALGFAELHRAGSIDRVPSLHAAQPRNCSPVDAAYHGEPDRPVAPTVAEGTAIRKPLRLAQILAAVRDTGGSTIAIDEDEIVAARADLARQGLFVEPTSATAAAAFARLRGRGTILPGETAVVVLTGSGLKSPEMRSARGRHAPSDV